MKKNYQTKAAPAATDEVVAADTVSVAMGELAETVKEGLLALAVGAGLQVMQVMMAKLSTRRYSAGLEPVGTQVEASARSTSKSAVSRRFVTATESALATMLATDLSGLDLVALMIDGVHFADHQCVVALGIGIDGRRWPRPWPARCAPPTTTPTPWPPRPPSKHWRAAWTRAIPVPREACERDSSRAPRDRR